MNRGLSSTSDPNSMASPVSCWDEETQQNDRRYFPKGTNFQPVSQGEVNEVVARLNSISRKVLAIRYP